jgi:enoyl-CoA hydratase/carnithine racemase
LLTKMVDDAVVDSTAAELAGKLAIMPPVAMRETKRLLRLPFATAVAAQMEEEAQAFSKRLTSPEFRDAATKVLSG